MKKIFTIIIIILLPVLSRGQSKEVHVADVSVSKDGKEVQVKFRVYSDRGAVKSNYKIILTPVLYDRQDSVVLPRIEMFGKQKVRRERQERLLAHLGELPASRMRVPVGETAGYMATIPYEKWMKTVSLKLNRQIEGCCSGKMIGDEDLMDNIILYRVPVPVFEKTEIKPVITEMNKRWQFGEGKFMVHFIMARAHIVPTLMTNEQTLAEISEAIHKIRGNSGTVLREIEISGFASPEGTLQFNTRLGQKRASALKNYIQKEIPGIPDASFKLTNGAENWEGLRKMVAVSGMPFRNEVLNIIDNVPVLKGREKQLMDLKWGRPYNYMLKEFFPVLRNACYVSVYYDVLGDPIADAINQATELIHKGNYADALTRLESVDTDSRAYNAIGVCYMMTEDNDMATRWFEKAIKAGNTTAIKNLEQMK